MNSVLYNTIGRGYNQTRSADPHIVSRLIHFLEPLNEKQYLDIGCGTGNYTSALHHSGLKITGVDPSGTMLEQAKARNEEISWQSGSAEVIPFPDQTFDAVLGTLTLHHWADLHTAFAELYRVTKSNASLLFLTSFPSQMQGYWLNHYFPQMLEKSLLQMPSLQLLQSAFEPAGWELEMTEKYFVRDDLKDHFLYVGKHRPHMYFDETIRAGISSFANLALEDEVNKGMLELKQDIQNNTFADIQSRFDNEEGDYMFIRLKKKDK